MCVGRQDTIIFDGLGYFLYHSIYKKNSFHVFVSMMNIYPHVKLHYRFLVGTSHRLPLVGILVPTGRG